MTTIGTSELAVILGIPRRKNDGEPYTSAVELWARMAGLLVRYESSSGPDAELGHWFEPAVLNRYASERGLVWGQTILLGTPIDQPGTTAPGIPWHVHFDGYNRRDNCPAEAKCPRTLERFGDAGTDQVPPEYAAQLVGQVAIAHRLWGADHADLAAMARAPDWNDRRTWATYTLERDPGVEADVIGAVSAWIERHVETGIPPEPDGSESAAYALRRMYRVRDGAAMDATDTDLEAFRKLLSLRSVREDIAGHLAEVEQQIQIRMAESTELVDPQTGRTLVTWRANAKGTRIFLVKSKSNQREAA